MSTNNAFFNFLRTPAGVGLLTLLALFVFGLTSIALEVPTGSIDGHISLEQPDFKLQSYDLREHKVYALVTGPGTRGDVERGVWVNRDGSFKISRLPVGEYQLKVRAPGFSTARQTGIFVTEADTTHLQALAMSIQAPSVNVASNCRVFTTKETPYFWLNASGSVKANVRIYKKDILSLVKANKPEFSSGLTLYKPWDVKTPLFEKETPLFAFERKLEPDEEDWARANITLDASLDRGDYVAVVEVQNFKGDKDWNVLWFSVSDVGLIVKQAPEQTLVRAIDLNTLQPVSGVNVALYNKPEMGRSLAPSSQTGADGFARFKLPGLDKRTSLSLLAVGTHGADRAYGGSDYWSDGNARYSTYFYTERPIYRLGQTVFFKGISRQMTQDGFVRPKPGTALSLTIEDPDNNKLWEGKSSLNAHGTFNGTWQIPDDGKTGAYQLTIGYPDGTQDYERFEVAQYRKPEYQVEVIPLQKRVTGGEHAKARVKATYFFGAPVTHAKVKYTVYAATDWSTRYQLQARPEYEGYFDDWDDEDYGDYAGDYVTEGYAQTDETGEAIIDLDTRAFAQSSDDPYSFDYQDKRYTIQAEVTDLSRMAVIGSGSLAVSAGDYALFVEPDSYVFKTGEPVQAKIAAVDYEGKPVANQAVSVALKRWRWDSVNNVYKGTETVETQSVTTDADGKAAVSLKTPARLQSDTYFITASARDGAGHGIYDHNSVWIASESNPYVRDGQSANQEAFSIKLDKSVYQPGQTVKAMITAPVTGKEHAQVWVAVEGLRLHETRLVEMNATAKLVELPIKAAYAPNVYVSATLVGPKHQFYTQSELVKVSPQQHFLNLAVATDKPRYKPGETVTYTVTATHENGKPAANTELSLGVVDESIYSIRPEAAQDIRKFFYRQQPNLVTTFSTFPEEYSGGPDKIEPKVRKDFRDVAGWQPTLVTNAQGVATAKIKLPDNLTTWRATVRGIQADADVGSAVQKVIATQDILVRLALPRFYTQHDQATVTAIVHNYSEQDQDIDLAMRLTPELVTKEALIQKLHLKPEEAKRYTWPVSVESPGKATVHVKAVGQTGGDAMELQLPVNPLGYEAAISQAGVETGSPATVSIPLNVPKGVDPSLVKVSASVAASTIGPVLGSFDDLIDYPYGCTEQTMSRLMPSIIAARLSGELNVALPAGADAKFRKVYLKAQATLRDYRHGDGGWGWWKNDESDPYLTAYVMEGVKGLQSAGYAPDLAGDGSDWESAATNWLKTHAADLTRQLKDPKLVKDAWNIPDTRIDLAYMQYVLALYGQKMPADTRALFLNPKAASPPEALAYQTLAFAKLGDRAAAKKSLAMLDRLAQHSGNMTHWDHTQELQRKLGLQSDWQYTYRFTGIEGTALILRAQVAAGASESRVDAIKQWLLLQRNANGWDNTKTTSAVLLALMEDAVANGNGGATDFSVVSKLFEAPVHFDPGNRFGPEVTVRKTLAELGENVVTLMKEGPGRLYYRVLSTFTHPLKPGDHVDEPALPQGLKIHRAFYRIVATPVGDAGKYKLTAQPLTGKVKAGETLLMKVVVEAPVALPYVMVVAALPSGGEVVMDDPRNSLTESEGNGEDFIYDWGNWWWSHQDALDDRVVLFANRLPEGKSEFHTMIRMELPGKFQMNPVRLEGMYSKHVRALSDLDTIEVAE